MPGTRTSHDKPVPRLGGTMVFAGTIISSILFTDIPGAYELKFIIAGLMVLFFIGLKDDIVTLQPIKKAAGQFIAALILVLAGGFRITGLFGMFGLYEIPYLISAILTLFIVLFIINSINFIDGVDGLASGTGIMVSVLLGGWFFAVGQNSYAVMSFSLAGALVAFFYYNVFSKRNKIFLGDTGSMVIGFMLAVIVIKFLMLNSCQGDFGVYPQALPLALALLFFPVFDTLRICVVRLMHGKSIFEGDNNHIHHRLLKISGSHLVTTLIMLLINIILIVVIYLLRNISGIALLLLLLGMGIGFSLLLGVKPNNKQN